MTKAVQKRETTQEIGVRVNTEMNRLVSQAPREAEGEGLTGMLDRILSATGIEDLAGMGGKMDNGKAIANKPMLITRIIARDSDIADAPLGIFLTVYYERMGHNGDGEFAFNTGALTVVATLLKLYDLDLFPVAAHLEVKDLKGGNTALNIILD